MGEAAVDESENLRELIIFDVRGVGRAVGSIDFISDGRVVGIDDAITTTVGDALGFIDFISDGRVVGIDDAITTTVGDALGLLDLPSDGRAVCVDDAIAMTAGEAPGLVDLMSDGRYINVDDAITVAGVTFSFDDVVSDVEIYDSVFPAFMTIISFSKSRPSVDDALPKRERNIVAITNMECISLKGRVS